MTDWYRKENGEIDREKVIDELERDLVREPDEQTHIIGVFDKEAVGCALELLKAQEPVKPIMRCEMDDICSCIDNVEYCGKCGAQIGRLKQNYCLNCGQAVKRE